MRIWFVPVTELDDRHLLGEHLELHTMANALIRNGGGWRNHPATRMFEGKLGALYRRHEAQVEEMYRRGFRGHKTPFPVEMIPPEEMDAEIEVTEEMLANDRADLAERQRLSSEHGGLSWRKVKEMTENRGMNPLDVPLRRKSAGFATNGTKMAETPFSEESCLKPHAAPKTRCCRVRHEGNENGGNAIF